MQEVYRQNPALGDANGPEILKKINENAQKLNDLQSEYKKFQVSQLYHPFLCPSLYSSVFEKKIILLIVLGEWKHWVEFSPFLKGRQIL